MKKLKILEVNKAYHPHVGGIETLVKQYSENLKQFGENVLVLVCRDDKGKPYTETVDGVKVLRAGSLGTYFSCPLSLSFILRFRSLAKKADIVHIHVPFPLADVALLLSGYKGKVAVSWHSDIVKQKKLMVLYKPFMNYLLKRADIIFTATSGHIRHSSYLKPYRDKCQILPYGIDPLTYLCAHAYPKPILTEKLSDKSSVKVFFTGRLVYYKGVDVLLDAFEKVRGCELFIAGTGELEDELKRKAAKYGDKVHFLGFLSDDDLKQAYRECDIFVLPSVAKSEAFGIVQLEAMIYSKPVINTALPSGVPYVSLDGKTGLTVPPSDADALADAINKLAADKELRQRLGAAGSERVFARFSEYHTNRDLQYYLNKEVGL